MFFSMFQCFFASLCFNKVIFTDRKKNYNIFSALKYTLYDFLSKVIIQPSNRNCIREKCCQFEDSNPRLSQPLIRYFHLMYEMSFKTLQKSLRRTKGL